MTNNINMTKSKELKRGGLYTFYWADNLTEYEVGCDNSDIEGRIYPLNGIGTITLVHSNDFSTICNNKSLGIEFNIITPEMSLDLLQQQINNEKRVN